MSEGTMVTLRIHFGGLMEKVGESYKYNGELGVNTVRWELYDISWQKFMKFCKEDVLVSAPIRFIWYKDLAKEMKTVNYIFEENPEDMFLMICVGKETGEIEVFIEHDISEHVEPPLYLATPNSQCKDVPQDEDEDLDSEEEVDRPLEDEEPDQSEDEMNESVAEEEQEHVGEEENEHVADGHDSGDDIVEDVGDGGDDGRFKAIFEEGSMAKVDKEAYHNFEEKEEATREAEESEEEGVIEDDAEYPDTPLESDEEWEQWNKATEKREGKKLSFMENWRNNLIFGSFRN